MRHESFTFTRLSGEAVLRLRCSEEIGNTSKISPLQHPPDLACVSISTGACQRRHCGPCGWTTTITAMPLWARSPRRVIIPTEIQTWSLQDIDDPDGAGQCNSIPVSKRSAVCPAAVVPTSLLSAHAFVLDGRALEPPTLESTLNPTQTSPIMANEQGCLRLAKAPTPTSFMLLLAPSRVGTIKMLVGKANLHIVSRSTGMSGERTDSDFGVTGPALRDCRTNSLCGFERRRR